MGRSPFFLPWPYVKHLHDQLVLRYGGKSGLHDQGLLESAVAHARTVYHYQHADLAQLAATYMFHIIKNHAFVDGNKRTGFMAATVFLEINEVPIPYARSLEVAAVAVADNQMGKEELAEFMRRLIRLGRKLRREREPVWPGRPRFR